VLTPVREVAFPCERLLCRAREQRVTCAPGFSFGQNGAYSKAPEACQAAHGGGLSLSSWALFGGWACRATNRGKCPFPVASRFDGGR
jgi:hypothetical protein